MLRWFDPQKKNHQGGLGVQLTFWVGWSGWKHPEISQDKSSCDQVSDIDASTRFLMMKLGSLQPTAPGPLCRLSRIRWRLSTRILKVVFPTLSVQDLSFCRKSCFKQTLIPVSMIRSGIKAEEPTQVDDRGLGRFLEINHQLLSSKSSLILALQWQSQQMCEQ